MTETASAPSTTAPSSIAVLTSGGDAGGMNPAIRAVVRTAVHHGIDAYAVADGYRGLIQGGDAIRRVESADVGGILQRGGTIIGTARSMEFWERDGRRRAARNLLELGVDALVVIGGDGSLTGANLLREEWPELLSEETSRRPAPQASSARPSAEGGRRGLPGPHRRRPSLPTGGWSDEPGGVGRDVLHAGSPCCRSPSPGKRSRSVRRIGCEG
jgi:hypothetical protein